MSRGPAELGTYEFDSDLTLEQMRASLNAEGSWEWVMGDSYWYGDYLRTGEPSATQVRIIEHGGGAAYVGPRPPVPRYLIVILSSCTFRTFRRIRHSSARGAALQ